MPDILDDKSEHCIPFILQRLQHHRRQHEVTGKTTPPFFLGLNGVQGAGKTTLVSALSSTLSSPPHALPVAVLSIDDLYLPHDEQRNLAASHPDNPLVQHRGVPSTHDVKAGIELFRAIAGRTESIPVPSYDKSCFDGAGDRRPQSEWETINRPGQQPVEVVVFEGWCVGFRALRDEDVTTRWEAARHEAERDGSNYQGRLGKLKLEDVQFINRELRKYDELTDRFDAFVHIDAEDALYVYQLREEQEAAMRQSKGTGMTPEQVIRFVDGYYPCYELYTDKLRDGIFGDEKERQLRLVVGRDRRVKTVQTI